MTFATINYRLEGPVAMIGLNRPDKLNAISQPMVAELNQAMDIAEADNAVRAILLYGEGKAFSAGFDIEGGTAEGDITAKRALLENDFKLIMRFWDSPKPTIAALHKYCLGSALEIAMACDITLCAENTRLGVPEVKFGSGIVALLMPWISGPKQAKELLLSGNDRVTPERALQLGLINQVSSEDALLSDALQTAHNLAILDQTAVRLTKLAINRSCDIMGLRQALLQALELDVVIETTETDESRQFNEVLAQDGLKAALAWREGQFASPEG